MVVLVSRHIVLLTPIMDEYFTDPSNLRKMTFALWVVSNRPFITLSYAQSLDGSIALFDKRRALISGTESLVLTHAIRRVHDAILVGAGTIDRDNPKLTVR